MSSVVSRNGNDKWWRDYVASRGLLVIASLYAKADRGITAHWDMVSSNLSALVLRLLSFSDKKVP